MSAIAQLLVYSGGHLYHPPAVSNIISGWYFSDRAGIPISKASSRSSGPGGRIGCGCGMFGNAMDLV
jgi:hypothetical protein